MPYTLPEALIHKKMLNVRFQSVVLDRPLCFLICNHVHCMEKGEKGGRSLY